MDDTAHCESIHRVVARDREDPLPIGHHDVPTLAHDPESGFLERPNGVEMVDSRELGQGLRDLDFPDLSALNELITHDEILVDRLAYVRDGFRLSSTL